ncbi:hypothetical protein [Metabacillus litoralis]|jgi:hypothetical protein|uniref:hypothetical protein n=1 Tax=Metabacillus litoralis TaxID=152268 RepID=UPI00203F8FB2|nr:hypothetical protein [Metabacillus litoralis]MCM3651041.1 hypothetical protein [Metabacillus litoralis]
MENLKYPKSYKCVCGREAKLYLINITTKFKDTYITVVNVPTYECLSNHVKMAQLTRMKIKQLLKEAYNQNLKIIEYID